LTEIAVTKEESFAEERTMGRKFTVAYGLYRPHGFVNPFLAKHTGFNDTDQEMLLNALVNASQVHQSAARGELARWRDRLEEQVER
jgi:CRISPR-associated protein Csd2